MKQGQLTATQVVHRKEKSRIRNAMILLAIVVLGAAVAAYTTAPAQNTNRRGAPNLELTSTPQISGISNTAPNAVNPQPPYNYVAGEST
jgi:hypothetical protein